MEGYTRDSSAYEDLLPLGGTDEEVIWTKISAQWERYVPKLITAASVDEFDAVYTEYIDTPVSYTHLSPAIRTPSTTA